MLSRSCVAIALVIAVSLVSALSVRAIPSLTPHENNEATILWEEDGIKDGSSAHNHRSARSFGGESDEQPQYLNHEPYTAHSVWDDRMYRYDPVGLFSQGHGFIDEAAGMERIPRYFFSDGEEVWPEWAKDRVREAFQAWSDVTSDYPGLVTGIAFRETTDAADADIMAFWLDLSEEESFGYWSNTWQELGFDSTTDWYEQKNPSGISFGQCHFFTVALHEIGHAVGLAHQEDADDMMSGGIAIHPCEPGGTYFVALDADSIEGVRDLYSIPVSAKEEPSPTSTATPPPTPTATPVSTVAAVPTPYPGVATIALPPPGEAVPLYEGCNLIALTFEDGTSTETVAEAVDPAAALDSMWLYDAAQQRWEGFSAAAPEASDFLTVNFLDTLSVCVTAVVPPSTPTPPQPSAPTPTVTAVPTATPEPSPLAEPIAGARYLGKTSQGTKWRFEVNNSGRSVVWFDSEVEAECTGGPPRAWTTYVYPLEGWFAGYIDQSLIPIRNGSFYYSEPGLEISGRFTSPATAEGEVRIWEEDDYTYPGYTMSCDTGTVTWTASIRVGT